MHLIADCLLPVILCFLIKSSEVRAESFKCIKSENCTCSKTLKGDHLECILDEHNLTFDLKGNNLLLFKCSGFTMWNLTIRSLPDLQVGDVDEFQFEACPLPQNFRIITKKFRINKVKRFRLRSFNRFEKANITRQLFQGLSRIESLRLNGNNIHSVHEDAFADMYDLKQLEMRINDIILPPGLFRNSKKLQLLILSGVLLKRIPEGLFDSLDLTYLFLLRNNLTYISGKDFKNLKNLRALHLKYNDFEVLDPNSFVHLKNLKSLSIGHKLTRVPENLFSEIRNLEQLYLNKNLNLVSLPERLLANLPNLRDVFLDENALLTLPSNLFENSTGIWFIHLQNNKLTVLPEKLFRGLSEVEKIYLHNNELKELPKDIFQDMRALKELYLNDNQLTVIGPQTFSTLENLHLLRLDNNLLQSIAYNTFSYLGSLKEVYLEKNLINAIDVRTFWYNDNLNIIRLGHNNLTFEEPEYQMYKPFTYCPLLRELDISYNSIKHLPKGWIKFHRYLEIFNVSHNLIDFINFEDLKMEVPNSVKIDLRYNIIKIVDLGNANVIPKVLCESDGYKVHAFIYDLRNSSPLVYLAGNPIKCVCDTYNLIRYFEGSMDQEATSTINISADNVTRASLPWFADESVSNLRSKMLTCDKVEYLQVNDTCSDTCDCFVRLGDMTMVYDCSFKSISHVPKISFPFQKVEVHLEESKLVESASEGVGYENVTKLYLSKNNISTLKWLPPKVELLHLDHNNISFFDYDILSQINSTRIKETSLGDNPWECDCSAVNLSNFLNNKHFSNKVDTSKIACKNSVVLLMNFSENDLCPIHIISFTLLAALLIILSLVALYYRYKQEIKIWLFVRNMCLWFVMEDELDTDKQFDAFITYTFRDEDFVADHLLPYLKSGPHPYKLCLHFRDWIPGEFMTNLIISSIENSRRTIVILSKNFLESVWCKMELRTAHMQTMSEGKARVIYILLEELDPESLDVEFKTFLKSNTCVKWGDPWFWNKLRYALPHRKKMLDKRHQRDDVSLDFTNSNTSVRTSVPLSVHYSVV